MQRQKIIIRLLGALITLLGAMHLFLNISILGSPSIIAPDELRNLMHALSRTFGPIAIREDRDLFILCIKITVSALFFTSGIGVITFQEWARKLLFCLLGARILYGITVCIAYHVFHPHLLLILLEGLLLFYYFTRPSVKQQF